MNDMGTFCQVIPKAVNNMGTFSQVISNKFLFTKIETRLLEMKLIDRTDTCTTHFLNTSFKITI